MLVTLDSLFSSRVVSMLVKSTCKRSIRAVATIGCRGTLDKLPSCCKQHTQDLMDCCIWLAIPGHQRHSHNKDNVWSQPWWPATLWHPFKVVTQWALGTMKSRRSSVSPFGVEHEYKALWWIVKFWRPVLPEVPSNLSFSVPSASLTLHLTLGPLSVLLP